MQEIGSRAFGRGLVWRRIEASFTNSLTHTCRWAFKRTYDDQRTLCLSSSVLGLGKDSSLCFTTMCMAYKALFDTKKTSLFHRICHGHEWPIGPYYHSVQNILWLPAFEIIPWIFSTCTSTSIYTFALNWMQVSCLFYCRSEFTKTPCRCCKGF